MSPFHSGLNHWQRQWLSDRLHKKNQPEHVSATEYSKAKPDPAVTSSSNELQPAKAPGALKRKASAPRSSKTSWPSVEILGKLLWEKPTSQIAKDLGVSDKAVEKHCKKLALKQPPRGYWAKIRAKINARPK